MNRDVTASLELVRRAQAGDAAALDALLTRYQARVLRIVRLRMGPKLRPVVDSQDILQNTFIAAVRCFERFEVRDEGSLINWLARIAERQIRDARRHVDADKRQGNVVSLDSLQEAGAGLAATAEAPLHQAAANEQATIVDVCVEALSELHRELILLRDYAGCDWQEIAEQTGRPSPDAARMMHGTAVLELAKRLLLQNHARRGEVDGSGPMEGGAGPVGTEAT